MTEITRCPECLKSTCVCEAIKPVSTRLCVVILQHPQEKNKELGTAYLLHKMLPNSVLKTGLSWGSLHRIVGREVSPKKWGVLYAGTKTSSKSKDPISVVDKAGNQLPDQASILAGLEGIVLLDGNWRQAKTMWWRNPWLLKLQRMVLNPGVKSLYGNLRREPRANTLSTIEAAAFVISNLEDNKDLYDTLTAPLKNLVTQASDVRRR